MSVKAPQQNMETEAGNSTQLPGDTFLADLLGQFPEYFDSLLKNNDRYRIQIIYSQIDRGANGMPKLTHHYFNLNADLYFYPASTVL